MEVLAGTVAGTVETLLAEAVPTGSQCLCFTQKAKGDGHTGTVRAICQRGRRVTTGGSDGRVTVADLQAEEHERTWKQDLPKGDPVICLDISHGGKFCFVGTRSGRIFVIHLPSRQLIKMLDRAHKGPVLALRVHPERFTVYTVGKDQILSAWSPAPDKIGHVKLADPKIKLIEFNPCGGYLALVTDSATNVVSVDTGKSLHRNNFSSCTVAVGWLSETKLCVGTEDGFVTFSDLKGRSIQLSRIPAVVPAKMTALAIDRSRQFMATADSHCEIILWRIESNGIQAFCLETVEALPTCLTLATEEQLGLHRMMRQELEQDGYVFADWD